MLIFLLCLPIVFADTNMDLFVGTDQDLNANIGLYAGGDVNLNIDGYDFGQEMSSMQESISNAGCDMNYVLKTIQEIYYEYDYQTKTFIPIDNSELQPYEARLKYSLDLYFVPRYEYNELKNRVTNLELEIEAIHKLFTEEEICNARMSVVKDFDLDSVQCGDTTWYNHMEGNQLIGLTPIEAEHTYIPEEVIVEEEKDCLELAKETLPQPYALKMELNQLVAIHNRKDWSGLETYMQYLSEEVVTAYYNYLECKQAERGGN